MAKIYKLLHYKSPLSPDFEYATVSERDYPKTDLYKYYSKDRLPVKYRDIVKRPCDEKRSNIEKWYL